MLSKVEGQMGAPLILATQKMYDMDACIHCGLICTILAF